MRTSTRSTPPTPRSIAIIRFMRLRISSRRCGTCSASRSSNPFWMHTSGHVTSLERSMRHVMLAAVAVLLAASAREKAAAAPDPNEIIAMERAALDRWGKGDPRGYLEIYAPDATYFDPMQDARIDGLESLRRMLAPWTG